MNIIIIGSKGFIGKNLFHYYKTKGHTVWGADVIAEYTDRDHYFLIDISNSDFSSIFKQHRYEICVNCAGAASVPESLQNPLRDYYLNVVNVFKLVEAIRINQPDCKFINLSSAAVYGNPRELPVSELANPNPLSPYGIHKMQAEMICKEFSAFYRVQTCSIRIFSVYGNGLKKQLFWDLYNKIKTGNPFKLHGTGNESRDFIHVLDLVRAIEIVSVYADFNGDIVNVANGEEVFIKDAVELFVNCFGSEVQYNFSGEKRKGDPVNWKADISKLSSYGYIPTIDLPSGLKDYYNWVIMNSLDD